MSVVKGIASVVLVVGVVSVALVGVAWFVGGAAHVLFDAASDGWRSVS